MAELFDEIQPPAYLERFLVWAFERRLYLFRYPIPEIGTVLGTIGIVDEVRQYVVDEVWGVILSGWVVRPFAGNVVVRKAVSPVFVDGDKVAVEDFELPQST